MPLPLLPGVHRVALTHGPQAGAVSPTNVMHFFSTTLTSAQVITALQGAAAAGMWDAKSTGLVPVAAVATELDNLSPSIEGTLTGAGWSGTGTGEVSPASSIIVTLKTTARGRRHTGRVFVGGVTEDKIGGGATESATLATMQGAWTTFIANAAGAGIPLHVTSYGYTRKPSDPDDGREDFAASTLPVVSATVQLVLGTQRRRQSRLRN